MRTESLTDHNNAFRLTEYYCSDPRTAGVGSVCRATLVPQDGVNNGQQGSLLTTLGHRSSLEQGVIVGFPSSRRGFDSRPPLQCKKPSLESFCSFIISCIEDRRATRTHCEPPEGWTWSEVVLVSRSGIRPPRSKPRSPRGERVVSLGARPVAQQQFGTSCRVVVTLSCRDTNVQSMRKGDLSGMATMCP